MAEVRDPIHQFIQLTDLEVRVIDTRPVQRLREIHQLSTGFLVWPGATHSRFEHALGTMELAGRAFETAIQNARRDAPAILNVLGWDSDSECQRAKSFVRLAALLHDVGHSPFSHGPERLFPTYESNGTEKRLTHEEMTARIILESEIAGELRKDRYGGFDPDTVADIAVGSEYRPGFSDDRTVLLTELVTGSVGVDRWDYLLRDSTFTGVRYGLFDVERLLVSLTIADVGGAPKWALKSGGQYSAEQMLLARWFMWLNMYTHKTRRILDLHLEEFLRDDLEGGTFPEVIEDYLALTDATVIAGIRQSPEHCRRILERQHFRQISELHGSDFNSPESFKKFVDELGLIDYRIDDFSVQPSLPGEDDFYVVGADGDAVSIVDSLDVIGTLKGRWTGRIYVPLDHRENATIRVNEARAARAARGAGDD